MDIQSLAQIISEGFLETLLDPAWVKDAGHRYVVVNRAFRQMCLFRTGGAELDVIDVTDFNLFPLELAEQLLQEDGEVAASCQAHHGKLFLFSPAGESRHYATHRIALLDGKGGWQAHWAWPWISRSRWCAISVRATTKSG